MSAISSQSNYNVDGRVWEESYPDQKLPISSTVLRALTADQCYLYAGNVTDSDEDRAGYSLTVKVDKNSYEDSVNDETGAEIRKYTVVTIGSKMRTKTLKMKATVKAGLRSQELPTLLTTIWRM